MVTWGRSGWEGNGADLEVDETGGHDLLEPVHAGRPVLFGPNVHGVEVTARALVAADAAVQVADGRALGEQILLLLDSTRQRADRVTRATALVEQSRVALEANLRLVLDHAEADPGTAREPASIPSEPARGIFDPIPDRPGGLYAREGPTRSRWRASLRAAASAVYGVGVRLDRWAARPRALP